MKRIGRIFECKSRAEGVGRFAELTPSLRNCRSKVQLES
jgi:hypothetical protein